MQSLPCKQTFVYHPLLLVFIQFDPFLFAVLCCTGDSIYELFSVLVHSGGAMGGHYYAFIKNFADNAWLKFNDSSVTRVEPEVGET